MEHRTKLPLAILMWRAQILIPRMLLLRRMPVSSLQSWKLDRSRMRLALLRRNAKLNLRVQESLKTLLKLKGDCMRSDEHLTHHRFLLPWLKAL
jgi:hypothetical protein